MTHVHQGDFILHNNNAKIHAISIAKSDCYISDQPNELETAEKTYSWNKEGYRIIDLASMMIIVVLMAKDVFMRSTDSVNAFVIIPEDLLL